MREQAEMVALITEIRSRSLEVMDRLGISIEERETCLDEIDYCIDLALLWEFQPVDRSNPEGGFGPPELWVSTVVPAVKVLLDLRISELSAEELERAAIREVGVIVEKVGSSRAKQQVTQLIAALLEVLGPEAGDSQ